MQDQGDVLRTTEGRLTWLTLNRPRHRNALTFSMYEKLAGLCDEIDADKTVRVVILRGAGGAFAAGTDISQFRGFRVPQDAVAYEERLESILNRVETLSKPTLAMIDGPAAGGGAQLALACDLRICSMGASLGVPIAKTLGNCLSTSGYARLLEHLGPARTKELIYTGRMVPASEALELGLVCEVVEEPRLEGRVREVAQEIAANAPLTLQVTKVSIRNILRSSRPAMDPELVQRCYGSDDFKEGVDAFLSKRRPKWQGR